MSRGGRAERVGFLRAQIARIEALAPRRAAARPADRVALSTGRGFGLDGMLDGGLRRGALHEIVPGEAADGAAATGFAAALAARCQTSGGAARTVFWIVENMTALETGFPYGPGLAAHGLDPNGLVFVKTLGAAETLFAMEEALRCKALAAVIGETWRPQKTYDLAASRRLVLAAQKSGVPGLLLMPGLAGRASALSSGAETRFEVQAECAPPLPSAGGRLPLPGAAVWHLRLAKARHAPFGFDPEKLWPVSWDPAEASFRDALSLRLPARPANRPAAAQPQKHRA